MMMMMKKINSHEDTHIQEFHAPLYPFMTPPNPINREMKSTFWRLLKQKNTHKHVNFSLILNFAIHP
jgi:hypothetical protein